MLNPREILQACSDKEEQLQTLRQSPNENGMEISRLLTSLKMDYRRILTDYPDLGKGDFGKDIDGALWKQCFYRQIEEFRKSIKKTVAVIDDAATAKPTLVEKAKNHLVKLSAALSAFLVDSMGFYQALLLELEDALKQHPGHRVHYLQCIHRCLLYLGDLSRYRQLYSDEVNTSRDFAEARRYYERAAFVTPTSGNPHNQLAVLATYDEAECIAVYHYCRSILVEQPFNAGLENLFRVFEKNAVQYQAMERGPDLVEQLTSSAAFRRLSPGERNRRITSAKFQQFLVRFVHVAGVLCIWSRHNRHCIFLEWSSAATATATAATATSSQRHAAGSDSGAKHHHVRPPVLLHEETAHLIQNVLEDLDRMIATASCSEQLLMKLLIIAMFTVHYSSMSCWIQPLVTPHQTNSSTLDEVFYPTAFVNGVVDVASNDHQHILAESLALNLLFGVATKTANKVSLSMDPGEKSKKANFKLLPVLSVFCEWIAEYPLYLKTQNSTDISASTSPLPAVVPASVARLISGAHSNADLLRGEARARSSMRSSVSCLKIFVDDNLKQISMAKAADTEQSQRSSLPFCPLKENIELRGFLPLAARFEKHFRSDNTLTAPQSATDFDSRERRFLIIRDCIQMLTSPIAASTSSRETTENAQPAKHHEGGYLTLQNISGTSIASLQQSSDKGGVIALPKSLEKKAARAKEKEESSARKNRKERNRDRPGHREEHKQQRKKEQEHQQQQQQQQQPPRRRNDVDGESSSSFASPASKKHSAGQKNEDDGEQIDFPPLSTGPPTHRLGSRFGGTNVVDETSKFASSSLFVSTAPSDSVNPFGDNMADGGSDSHQDEEDSGDTEDSMDLDFTREIDAVRNEEAEEGSFAFGGGPFFAAGSRLIGGGTNEIISSEKFVFDSSPVASLESSSKLLFQGLKGSSSAASLSHQIEPSHDVNVAMATDEDEDLEDEVVFRPAFSRAPNPPQGNLSTAGSLSTVSATPTGSSFRNQDLFNVFWNEPSIQQQGVNRTDAASGVDSNWNLQAFSGGGGAGGADMLEDLLSQAVHMPLWSRGESTAAAAADAPLPPPPGFSSGP